MKFGILAFVISLLTGCSTLSSLVKTKHTQLEKLWVRSTLSSKYYGAEVNHRFQPVLFNNLVIQGNAVDGLKAFKKSNGKEVWSFQVKHGVEAGAAVYKDTIVFAAGDGFLYSINAKTGKEIWSFPLRSEGVSRPTVNNGMIYIATGNNVVYALKASTGERVWTYQRPEISSFSIRGASEALVVGPYVFLGFNDGYFVALNKTSGTLQWQTKISSHRRFKDVDAKSVYSDGVIYTASFSSGIYALKPDNGQILWEIDKGGYSNLLVVGKSLFVSTTTNEVLSIEKSTGVVRWSKKLEKGYLTAPQFYKGQLLIGTSRGSLYVLNTTNGKEITHYSPGRGVTSSVTIDTKGNVYFVSKSANLYAMKLVRK